jgi:hypothetical protein
MAIGRKVGFFSGSWLLYQLIFRLQTAVTGKWIKLLIGNKRYKVAPSRLNLADKRDFIAHINELCGI